ncbi:hypothetical protein DNTS_032601 [Danionella cerebrum]|nr:hypothetical protein DNTS_032601 [Danionella translucida]
MESRSVAYGTAFSGSGIDVVKFVKQPQTVLRLLSWLFSIVVFASITAECFVNSPNEAQARCVFNRNDSACNYAVTVGVLSFLICLAFLLADGAFPFISNVLTQRHIATADLGLSGLWTFLWFVCFCLLSDQWSRTSDVRGIPTDAVNAVVAFSFFSIASWAALTYLALVKFHQGVEEVTRKFTDAPPDVTAPYPNTYTPPIYPSFQNVPSTYPSFQEHTPDLYQQPPFSQNSDTSAQSSFPKPVY